MKFRNIMSICVVAVFLVTLGCQTEPKTKGDRESLGANVDETLKRMQNLDPGLNDRLNDAYGYVVFPEVGKGGLIVGGSYGRGEVYEQGRMIGYADITQATVGLQAGGQTFSELILFENKAALENFKYGKMKLAANASAVALKSGAAASARYNDGVAVFVEPRGGLMVEAAVGGQSFSFRPMEAVRERDRDRDRADIDRDRDRMDRDRNRNDNR